VYFRELREAEVRRIPIQRTSVNRGKKRAGVLKKSSDPDYRLPSRCGYE
jgi:hypothetical protein